MIDRDHGLSVSKQAKAFGISRGSVYYLPRPVRLMKRMRIEALKRDTLAITSSQTRRP